MDGCMSGWLAGWLDGWKMQENQFDISGLIWPLNFVALLMLHGDLYNSAHD